ncbi:mycothione reductase [Arthrobacter halodurans]|uniref:Mycothione reductase n=1 Tax=Arthrobacter halodurans TaxID=516699 RepID=A0ABV4UPA7_9MICC
MPHYDLAIIGSGSGNSLITPHWDDKRVALVDGGTFGGTCLNVGCIPTKMFVYPARLAGTVREAGPLGVDLELRGTRWTDIRDRVFGRIDAISAAGRRYRADELDHVDLYEEHARFTAPRTLLTDSGAEITADRIVVAAGSRAVLPDVPGMGLPQVHTSDTVMRLPELPRRVLVLGGGFIAAEFAHVFHGLGSDVVQVNRSARLLRQHDAEISRRFTEAAGRRWRVELGHAITGISANGDGSVTASFAANDAGRPLSVVADVVLVATGRVPNTDRLGAGAAGFDVGDDGTLCVDDYQRVLSGGAPVDGVYALGDVSNEFQLKHVANREARVVAHNLEHPGAQRRTDRSHVPAAVFSDPQIAAVGLTETQARERAAPGVDVVSVVQDYGSTAYGWAMEDTEGVVKLVAERASGKLLGAHIMGHEASLLIQPLVQAMAAGTDAVTLARGPYWIHPALAEVVENALLSLGVDVPADAPL